MIGLGQFDLKGFLSPWQLWVSVLYDFPTLVMQPLGAQILLHFNIYQISPEGMGGLQGREDVG